MLVVVVLRDSFSLAAKQSFYWAIASTAAWHLPLMEATQEWVLLLEVFHCICRAC